jgi:5-methylcytosine-specific restriction endonuclease McrA
MPNALLKSCHGKGGLCGELVARGLCPDCRRARSRDDVEHRGSSHARGYTRRWYAFKAWWIRKLIGTHLTAPVCGARWPGAPETGDSTCAKAGVLVDRDLHLDHIEPFRGDDGTLDARKQFDPLNMQLLCSSCHSRKTAMKDSRFISSEREGGYGEKILEIATPSKPLGNANFCTARF